MIGGRAWLRLAHLWAAPGALVLANAVWLLGVRSAVLGRGSMLERQRATVEEEVATLERHHAQLTATRASLATLEENLGSLRSTQLGSMGERLVAFLVDVARRTQAAGLQPQRIGYSVQRDDKSGLVHFAATFSVEGTYEEVRRCVNLLEASPQFVLVERLTLRGEDPAASLAVTVQLTVGTYFTDVDTGLMRDLGVEELPAGAGPAAPAGAVTSAQAAAPAAGQPPTDFSAVDAAILEDVRAAVSELGDEGTSVREPESSDVFTEPDDEVRDTGRRLRRPRSAAERRAEERGFAGRVGTREVSRGR